MDPSPYTPRIVAYTLRSPGEALQGEVDVEIPRDASLDGVRKVLLSGVCVCMCVCVFVCVCACVCVRERQIEAFFNTWLRLEGFERIS